MNDCKPGSGDGASGKNRAEDGFARFLGLSVGNLSRAIIWSLSKRTEEHGTKPGAFAAIAWLMQMGEATQAELTRLVGIEQPTMALTLQRMERDGLIERTPDPDHKRRTKIRLTTRGREVSDALVRAASEVETLAQQSLTETEVAEFYRISEKMTENLAADRPPTTRRPRQD